MGRGSSGAKTTGSGAATAAASTAYSLSRGNVDDFVKAEAENYLRALAYSSDPPETITINNVPFKLMYQPTEPVYDRYTDTIDTEVYYQSQIRATNGEWPVMRITVEEKRKYYSKRQGGGVKSREYKISEKKSGLV